MSHMQEKLQRAARLFFDRLSSPVQQQLVQTFRSMDANGDGRISLTELVRWTRATNPSSATATFAALPVIFAFVDADRNGTLDFEECKGLFFMGCTACRTCDGCGKLLVETAYTCADCNVLYSAANVGNSFDLCSSCYAIFKDPLPSMAARNPKLMHPHRNMVVQESGLADAIDDVFDQVQCTVCKEYHRSTAQGLFTQMHMHVGRGPYETTVCEWCIACLCSACGNHFQGPRVAACSGRWAMQGSGTCIPCRQRGIMEGSPFMLTFSPETLQKMESSPVFQECSTCKAKAKDGSLWKSVFQAMSSTRVGMFGNTNPSAYNMPYNNNIYGSGSFEHYAAMPSYHATGSNSYGGSSFSIPDFMQQLVGSMSNSGGAGPSYLGSLFNMLNNMQGNNTGSNPLDMIGLVNSMGNPMDMLSMVSACSIM